MKYIINNIGELENIAKDFKEKLSVLEDRALVVGLYGDLGAGKTTFTQILSRLFGVEDKIVSPTFVIEKIYPIRNTGLDKPISNGTSENGIFFTHLIHIDAYRIEKPEEMLSLGFDRIIKDKNNLILIEWPERISSIMPPHIEIHIKHTENDQKRELEIVV